MFTGINSFIVFFGALSLISWSFYTIMISQISNIEKAFGLTSSESGWMLTSWEIGYVICTVFASYFGQRVHLPRVIGIGTIVIGLTGFIFALPHFVAFSEPKIIEDENMTETSSTDGDDDVTLCTLNQPAFNSSSKDSDSTSLANVVKVSSKTLAYVLFVTSNIVQGAAKAPCYPYSSQYVDDNVPKEKTGFYIGIIASITGFGFALGYVGGSLISSVYVTLKGTTLSSTDARFIGAWWLGFIIVGMATILIAIPMFFFPRRLKSFQRDYSKHQTHDTSKSLVHQIKDVVTTIVSILRSPVYTLTLIAACFQILAFETFLGFEPKYIETQFKIPPWQVNILVGGISITSYSIGCLIGGFVTKKWDLSPFKTILLIIVLLIIVTIVIVIAAFLGCHQQTIHMTPLDQVNSSINIGCDCSGSEFLPICGNDGKSYYSPCHAGCTYLEKEVLSNCTAIPGGEATMGLCPSNCQMVLPYSIAKFIMNLIDAIESIPVFLVFLRSAGEEHKALAIGLSAAVSSLTAYLPGPVIGGKIIDSTCLIWNTARTSSKYCAHYNIEDQRFRMHILMIGLRVIAIAIFGLALIKAKGIQKWPKTSKDYMKTNVNYFIKEHETEQQLDELK